MGDVIRIAIRRGAEAEHMAIRDMVVGCMPQHPGWTKEGVLRPLAGSVPNIITVLERDPQHQHKYRRDLFYGVIRRDGVRIEDAHLGRLAYDLASMYGMTASIANVHQAIVTVSSEDGYHPVRDYLGGLQWDGTPRIDRWLTDWCGAPDNALSRLYARRWAVSCIARVMQPGCKVDTVLVLVGRQGGGKSSVLQALGGEWYVDGAVDPSKGKEAAELLEGAWIFELGELDSVRRAEATSMKAFLTRRVDKFRRAYGRFAEECQRQTVITGTTNEEAFLTDSTGNRRYWPVRVAGRIDVEAAQRLRDQFWAEAMAAYVAGEPWWLSASEEESRGDDLARYEACDPWQEILEAHGLLHEVRAPEVARILGIESAHQHSGTYRRIASVLQSLGYSQHRTKHERLWRKG